MADSLYVKTSDGFVKVNIGGGSGGDGEVTRKVLVSSLRSAVLSAGTAMTVPEYVLGDSSLELTWNGLLLAKGTHYTEASITTVTFTFDVAVDDVVVATVYNSSSSSATRTVQTDTGRSAVLTAGTEYTVPSHPVLEGKLQVFLDGLQYTDFIDTSKTTIVFDVDIPATTEIICVVG